MCDISSGCSKLWCVILDPHRKTFESFVPAELLAYQCLNDHYEGAWQIITMKLILLDPSLVTKIPFKIWTHKVVERLNQVLILGLGVYYGGFNAEYKIAKAIKFANFAWPEYGSLSAQSKSCERPFMQLTLTVRRISWMEAHMIIEAIKKEKGFPSQRQSLNYISGG